MPRLDDDHLQALARLARLELGDAHRAALRRDLERILTYVERLSAFDDPAVPPLRHPNLAGPTLVPDALRPDLPRAGLPRAALAAIAPAWRGDRVEVPRTVEHDD